MIFDYEIRSEIVEVARRLYIKGLNTTYTGNISSWSSWSGSFWITPRYRDKFNMKPDDLALVDIESGKRIMGGEPSSEVNMHIKIYRTRSDIRSIVHAHPPYTLALAKILSSKLVDIVDELFESKFYIGKLGIVKPIEPGTVKLADEVSSVFSDPEVTTVVLLDHGVVSIGSNLYDALNRIEILEHTAMIKILSTLAKYHDQHQLATK